MWASLSSSTTALTACFIVASTCYCILSSFLPHISLFHITKICCKYPQLQVALHVGVNNFKSMCFITDLFHEDIVFLFLLTWGTFIYFHFKPGRSVLCSVWTVAQNSGTFWINLEFLLPIFNSFIVNINLLE
jgi:hypothetical protein